MNEIFGWGIFAAIVLVMMFLDLGVFNRKAHEVKIKEALIWSGVWIGLALLFNLGILIFQGPDLAMKFLAGYLLEKSLSVDNLFVFLLVFSYFKVPREYQHKTLFWGILGAVVMRAIFIAAGVTLIHRFQWMIYVFGGFLIYTGWKLAAEKDKEIDPEHNPLLKIFRRMMPVTKNYERDRFFIRKDNVLWATPLFVVLLVIETTDVVFAIDSIPAILGITTDPFIVYTSNILAILGLRALYFALAGMMKLFHFLHYGLAAILIFIGAKMILAHWIHIPVLFALGVIAGVLGATVILSVIFPSKKEEVPTV